MNLKGYLVTGLLIWLPVAVTLWVLNLIVGTLDLTLNLLPDALRPERLFGFAIPGLGVLLAVAILLGTGMLAANVLGQRLIDFWHALLSRTPVVKSIYNSVKQISDTLLSDNGQAFKTPILVQFPQQGTWTVAFQTGPLPEMVSDELGDDYIGVYVPTIPNPTSGYFVMVPRAQTRPLNMSVDEALKYAISMGMVAPARKAG
ncbi:putative membrane protein [Crenobacter luteus]|nr:putative membrane protein [Crenobacter luteus]